MSFHLPSLSSDLTPWMDPLLSPQRCAIFFPWFRKNINAWNHLFSRIAYLGLRDVDPPEQSVLESLGIASYYVQVIWCMRACTYVKFNVVKNIDRLGSGQAWSSRRIGWSSYKDRPRRATAHSPKVSICISQSLSNHVFSFDIDVLDPSEAPATGTRVRGGLTLR